MKVIPAMSYWYCLTPVESGGKMQILLCDSRSSRKASLLILIRSLAKVMAAMTLAFFAIKHHQLCLADASQNNIAEATEKAAQFLISKQNNGTWQDYHSHQLGETSLVGLSLVHAGKEKILAVRAAGQQVRRYMASNSDTYDVSLAIMFLDSLEKTQDRYTLRNAGNRIVGGQLKNGAWSYGIPGDGRVDYRNTLSGGDNSCTQFAVMASWIARRHGTQNAESLRLADTYFRNTVDTNTGGWSYSTKNEQVTPSMTCAGLLALAAKKGSDHPPKSQTERPATQSLIPTRNDFSRDEKENELKKGEAEPIDTVVQRAFAYLGEQLRANPEDLSTDYYFLWSLERVGVIYGTRTIGGVDWYSWGSKRLLENQRPDGSWQAAYPATIDTSFALLFLTRANMATDLTAMLEGSGDPAIPQGAGGGNQFFKTLPMAPEGNLPDLPMKNSPRKPEDEAKNENPFLPD